ncbi:hypothetical protein HYH03_004020, partial [Edaphochlamys debaryana]
MSDRPSRPHRGRGRGRGPSDGSSLTTPANPRDSSAGPRRAADTSPAPQVREGVAAEPGGSKRRRTGEPQGVGEAGAGERKTPAKAAAALMAAVRRGDAAAARRMLAAGAPVDARDEHTTTPLHAAAGEGHLEVLQVLLEAGAEVDALRERPHAPTNGKRVIDHWTPLHEAAQGGHTEVVRALLEAGAHVEGGNKSGFTALHVAAMQGDVDMARALVEAGARTDARNQEGDTPADTAQHSCRREIEELLRGGAGGSGGKEGVPVPPMAGAIAGEAGGAEARGAGEAGAAADEREAEGPPKPQGGEGVAAEPGGSKRRRTGEPQGVGEAGAGERKTPAKAAAALMAAVRRGDAAAARRMLAAGAPVDARDEAGGGDTALHLAARGGHTEVLRVLLEAGAEVDALRERPYCAYNGKRLSDHWMPLHEAAQGGHTEVVRALLEAGAHVEGGNKSKWTPLLLAVRDGHEAVATALLGAGAEVNDCYTPPGMPMSGPVSALHMAAMGGHVGVARALLEAGAEVDAEGCVFANFDQYDHQTPLHVAAKAGSADMVELLVGAGANVNSESTRGLSPLHLAAAAGEEAAVTSLLQAGADRMKSPLHVAAEGGYVGVVRALLAAGADTEARDQEEATPLITASGAEVMRALLQAGACLEAKDESGFTALHVAAMQGDVDMARALVEAGARTDARNQEGDTPADTAQHSCRREIEELLRGGAGGSGGKEGVPVPPMAGAIAGEAGGAEARGAVAETLVYKRVEKERDDASMEVVQLKRLGVEHFDSFFADVEDAVNDVVKLNNAYQDALCDTRAALVEAISVEPARALAVEVATHGVRATPQLLLDVVYSDNGVRPSPKEVRHMLSARPAVAEADAAVARAVADLYSALAVPAVPVVRLTYNHEKHHLNAVPMSGATTSAPGAHGRLQKLQQAVASFNAAVTGLRKAAPGLRLRVEVVPCPAFHARTYAWRLLPREEALAAAAAREGAGGDTGGTSAAATPGGTQPAPRPYTPKPPVPPLQIAACHNAGAILEAAALVAHQAAAVAAATGSLPFTELHTRSCRRVIAASQPDAAAAAAAAAAVAAAASSATAPVSPTKRLGSVLGGMRHSISAFRTSVTGAPPDLNGHGTTVTTHGRTLSGGGALSGAFPGPNASPIAGVGAAAAGDEAMASLRRAITGANHALFRLSKLAAAAGTAPPPPAWLAGGRPGDGAVSVLAPAARFILESAVGAARAAAAVAAVVPGVTSFLKREATSRLSSDGLMTPRAASTAFTDGDGGGGGGGPGGGGGGGAAAAARMPASDLVTLEPRVTIASEHGSVIDSTYSNTFSGGITGQALNAVAEGLTPGWSWNWEWGIETQ